MFKLTSSVIKDTLSNLIGTKVGWAGREVEFSVQKLLNAYAKANDLSPMFFSTKKDNRGWRIGIIYRGYEIGGIEIKREKKDTHYNYLDSYTDYVYKDFSVYVYTNQENNEDVETYIKTIDDLISKREKIEEDKKIHGKNVIELLKNTYDLDEYEVNDLIEYLYKNRYNLR